MAVRDRIARAASWMRSPRPAPAPRSTPTAPPWVRTLIRVGFPAVLAVALWMCAPGEYHLARAAGWSSKFAYGMPVVLSAYAGIASAAASTRIKGERGRWSAILGAGMALILATAAQVVSHLISTGHLAGDRAWLIAATSTVPPVVVVHLLHVAATGMNWNAQDVPASAEDAPASAPLAPVLAPRPPRPPLVPAGTRLLPLVARSREVQDAEDAAAFGDQVDASVPVLLTTRQLADREGVVPSTVRNWVRDGRLKPVRTDDVGHWFDPHATVTAAVAD